jgi:hypothetical protein
MDPPAWTSAESADASTRRIVGSSPGHSPSCALGIVVVTGATASYDCAAAPSSAMSPKGPAAMDGMRTEGEAGHRGGHEGRHDPARGQEGRRMRTDRVPGWPVMAATSMSGATEHAATAAAPTVGRDEDMAQDLRPVPEAPTDDAPPIAPGSASRADGWRPLLPDALALVALAICVAGWLALAGR